MEQKSEEWLEARRGKFTASSFHKILGKSKKGQVSKSLTETAKSYILKTVAETFGSYEAPLRAKALDWGNEYEDIALQAYCDVTGEEILSEGFVLSSELEYCGASPDGLTACGNGGLEIKCPYIPTNHIKYATDRSYIVAEHYAQIQGNIWIHGLQWLDFVSFDPRSEKDLFITRFDRDEDYIESAKALFIKAKELQQELIGIMEA